MGDFFGMLSKLPKLQGKTEELKLDSQFSWPVVLEEVDAAFRALTTEAEG